MKWIEEVLKPKPGAEVCRVLVTGRLKIKQKMKDKVMKVMERTLKGVRDEETENDVRPGT